MNKILCIGASTYNEGTLSQINNALIKTNFLEEWAVIICIHNYLRLYEQNIDKISQEILNQDFANFSTTLVNRVQDYIVESGNIYILPDSMYCTENIIYIKIKVNNQTVIIKSSDSQNLIEETFKWRQRQSFSNGISSGDYNNNDFYLPCIDKIMTELSQTKSQKLAGLILAGMGKDGAEGLTAIAKARGHIAIQNPDECFAQRAKFKDTGSMPKEAIKQARQQKLNYHLIELNQEFSLINWLQSIK